MSQHGAKFKELASSSKHLKKAEAQVAHLQKNIREKDAKIQRLSGELKEVKKNVKSISVQLQDEASKSGELQERIIQLETELGLSYMDGYRLAQFEVFKAYPFLHLGFMDFGFDRDEVIAKFQKPGDPISCSAKGSS